MPPLNNYKEPHKFIGIKLSLKTSYETFKVFIFVIFIKF